MSVFTRLGKAIQLKGEEEETLAQFRKLSSRTEVLVMGQSDIKSALDPTRFPVEAFNLADYGENFIETYFKLKHHLADTPKLRMVIIPLAPWSFTSFRTDRLRTFVYRRGYIGWKDIPELRELKGPRVVRQKLKAYVQRVDPMAIKRTVKSVGRVLSGKEPLEVKGAVVRGHRRSTKSDVKRHAAHNMVRHHFEGSVLFDPHITLYFERFLRLCAEHGIIVVSVTCPVVDWYLEESTKHLTTEQVLDTVRGEWGLGDLIARHVDGGSMYATRHELFVDQNHLNLSGSELFTDHVLEQISDLFDSPQVTADS